MWIETIKWKNTHQYIFRNHIVFNLIVLSADGYNLLIFNHYLILVTHVISLYTTYRYDAARGFFKNILYSHIASFSVYLILYFLTILVPYGQL